MQMKASTMDTLKGLGRLQETFHNFFFFLSGSFSLFLAPRLPGHNHRFSLLPRE